MFISYSLSNKSSLEQLLIFAGWTFIGDSGIDAEKPPLNDCLIKNVQSEADTSPSSSTCGTSGAAGACEVIIQGDVNCGDAANLVEFLVYKFSNGTYTGGKAIGTGSNTGASLDVNKVPLYATSTPSSPPPSSTSCGPWLEHQARSANLTRIAAVSAVRVVEAAPHWM